jgi:hypothetical protein
MVELATVLLGDLTIPGQRPHVDEYGVAWGFQELVGWWDDTEASGGVVKNDFADGGWYEPSTEMSRAIVLNGSAHGDPGQMSAAIARLKANIPRTPKPFVVIDSQLGPTHVVARKEGLPSILWDGGRNIRYSIQLVAADQRILSGDGSGPTFTAGPVGLPKVIGGKRLKPGGLRIRPLRIVATVTSGQVVLGTSGNETPPTLLRVRGPVPDFTIKATLGNTVQVQRYIEAVPAGQYVDIDLDAKTVKINGNVNRRNKLLGPWIVPADGMVFEFTSSTQNDTASMEIFASSAWR